MNCEQWNSLSVYFTTLTFSYTRDTLDKVYIAFTEFLDANSTCEQIYNTYFDAGNCANTIQQKMYLDAINMLTEKFNIYIITAQIDTNKYKNIDYIMYRFIYMSAHFTKYYKIIDKITNEITNEITSCANTGTNIYNSTYIDKDKDKDTDDYGDTIVLV